MIRERQATTSIVVRVTSRVVARMIQIFAVYIIFHGHYSPGGGFQGGALLAAAVILLRLGEGMERSQREFPRDLALPLGAAGALLYLVVGFASILNGGGFLEYDYLPLIGPAGPPAHYWAILIIEVAVGLAVMSVLVGIFDRLMERSAHV